MSNLINFLSNYKFVLLVSAYFALTSIYSAFGQSLDVFWNTYIKTVRELFVIILLALHLAKFKNVLSTLFIFSAIGVSLYLTVFRWFCAYVSNFDYSLYRELMSSGNQSLMFILFIFIIFVAVSYLNKK